MPSPSARHGLIATIDLSAIAANFRLLQQVAPSARVAAAVKADAYGMGIHAVAPALAKAGCATFYVAHFDEAVELRALVPQAEIVTLHGIPPNTEAEAEAFRITPVINDPASLERLAKHARKSGNAQRAVLHVDTGINRLGYSPQEVADLAANPTHARGVEFTHQMSHLACSDEPGHPQNAAQRAQFEKLTAQLPPAPRSFANSCGIFLGPEYHYQQVRSGRALYGINFPPTLPLKLHNAIRLHTAILQTRLIDSKSAVGYGATQHVGAGSRLATISGGYADGLLRSMSNSDARQATQFSIAGHPAPLVGRVSMDLIVLDVTAIPEHLTAQGAEVEVVGRHQHIDELARTAGTIGYELMTHVTPRVTRRYIESGAAA